MIACRCQQSHIGENVLVRHDLINGGCAEPDESQRKVTALNDN